MDENFIELFLEKDEKTKSWNNSNTERNYKFIREEEGGRFRREVKLITRRKFCFITVSERENEENGALFHSIYRYKYSNAPTLFKLFIISHVCLLREGYEAKISRFKRNIKLDRNGHNGRFR